MERHTLRLAQESHLRRRFYFFLCTAAFLHLVIPAFLDNRNDLLIGLACVGFKELQFERLVKA
jgi:hypothetical protein